MEDTEIIQPSRRRGRGRRKTATTATLQSTILTVNGNKFVAGLHWAPLSNARNPMAEARAEGASHGWDVVSIKRGADWIQAGYVTRASGAYKGMYSVASALASILGDNWCGAFEVEDGTFLIVAVESTGRIVSSGDVVRPADSVARIFNKIQNDNNIPEDRLYAPASLELASKEYTLADLLPKALPKKARKDAQLAYLKFGLSNEQYRSIAIFIALMGAAFYAFHVWDAAQAEKQQELEQAQAQQRAEQLRRANENARMKLEREALAHPWAVTPRASDFVAGCEGWIDKLDLNIAGYNFQKATCSNGGVVAVYQRQPGSSITAFAETIEKKLPRYSIEGEMPVVGYLNSGDLATIAIKLNEPIAGDEALMPATTGFSALLGPLESANSPTEPEFTSMQVQEQAVVIPMPPPLPGHPPVKAPEATWRKLHYTFDSALQPKHVFTGMKHQDGLRLSSIVVALNAQDATLKWSFTGDFYVQR